MGCGASKTKYVEKVETVEKEKIVVQKKFKAKLATLGVIRLDYDYPPAPGDIDSPQSYEYKVTRC